MGISLLSPVELVDERISTAGGRTVTLPAGSIGRVCSRTLSGLYWVMFEDGISRIVAGANLRVVARDAPLCPDA